MDKILAVLNCTKKQKVLFATFKLTREAERQWHAVFYDRYFPATARNAKAKKFFNLTQRHLTVRQYATRFVKLSLFAPFMVPDEYQKTTWFERVLNQRIHEHMACLKIHDFTELVGKATVVESSLQRGVEALERRRRPVSPRP
ncbi:uncharacterized protein LOC131151257 [Malania oleifera]|uniref:uncharacterized protein LOC131151257 n=1 Tax=Malania oleifera TaxID=397392 RepID=UPI0025AE2051|nr:uncharacterized protein LOC131151257 [Malania oleifera]